MSYFSEWTRQVEDATDRGAYNAFVETYYKLEAEAYRQILEAYPEGDWAGTAAGLADRLGFDGNMVVFLGFLDGIQSSLRAPLDLEAVEDNTEIRLDIDFEQLYYNMHDAKARWLYELEAWDRVIPADEREAIAKRYRTEHIAVSNKIGRNDPCPCGSGKKYKKCCGGRPGAEGGRS